VLGASGIISSMIGVNRFLIPLSSLAVDPIAIGAFHRFLGTVPGVVMSRALGASSLVAANTLSVAESVALITSQSSDVTSDRTH